jgi:hypothetical protein
MSDMAELSPGPAREAPRVVLVLWPPDQPRDWLVLGTLRGHRVECVIEGGEALVRIGDWISPAGSRPVVEELRELLDGATGATAGSSVLLRQDLLEIDETDPRADPRREPTTPQRGVRRRPAARRR